VGLQRAANMVADPQGFLAHKKSRASIGPGPGHSPTAGSYEVVVSYERGTPVVVVKVFLVRLEGAPPLHVGTH
jgi:hypothetical protein